MRDLAGERRSALEDLQAGNLEEAERKFLGILRVQPENVSVLHFLGLVYYQRKEYDASIQCIGRALELGPDYVDAYNNLGIVLQESGRMDEAIANYQKAIELNPGFERAHYNLGTALKEKWRIDDAVAEYQHALRIDPNMVEAYNNLGLALQDQGRLEEAEAYYRRCLGLKPDFALCYSNLLLLLNYSARHDAQAVFSEHLRFARQVAEPWYPRTPHGAGDCRTSRRLRIGYVSPDFRRHSVNYFIEPVLASHSRNGFEVFCYSDVLSPDHVTARLKGYAEGWRDIAGMSDERVAGMVRGDGIDILVDLAGHTGYNRMLMFARKPAPVQVSWLGYPNTTGLATMDYRIVDSYTDPPGLTDPYYRERLVRMPESFLCYLADPESPPVLGLPARHAGVITFGSFNYFPKVSRETVVAWSAILRALPGSRLIMKARNFSDEATRRYAMDMFAQQGIIPERIELVSIKASFGEHLDMYNRIDIALDSFPYNGTTTTCEALWMGVPVITLAGNTHASRVGVSLLTNVGLSHLVAGTREEYESVAVSLGEDIPRLAALREGLRGKMASSPLTDALRFTVNLEKIYRAMWEAHCTGG